MPNLGLEQAHQRFLKDGQNSSHFVWFLPKSDLRFFETRNGFVFSYLRKGAVTLFSLEPLTPKMATSDELEKEFLAAWSEVEADLKPTLSAFVAVYPPFADLLRRLRFERLKIGREPWVNLAHCIPKGNSGKGVRSARNFALKNGLKVMELLHSELEPGSSVRLELESLLVRKQRMRLLHLDHFLNATDAFSFNECRRYFVARNAEGRLEGFLIATPIPRLNSYFQRCRRASDS